MIALDFLTDEKVKQSASDFLGEADEKIPVRPQAAAFLDEEVSPPAPRPLNGTQPIQFSTPAEPILDPNAKFEPTPFSKEFSDIASKSPLTQLKFDIKPDEDKWVAAGKEAINFAIGIPEFLTSLKGAATIPAAAVAPAVTAAAFTGDMLYGLGKQIYSNYKNWDEMTPAQKSVAWVDMGGTGLLAGVLGRSTVKGLTPKESEVQNAEAIRRNQEQLPASGQVAIGGVAAGRDDRQHSKQKPPEPVVAGEKAPQEVKPPSLTRALEDKGKPVRGGASHSEIFNNYKGENKVDVAKAMLDDSRHVFGDENGNVLNRADAAKKFDEMNGNKPGTTKELQSEDLRPADKPPTVPPIKPEEAGKAIAKHIGATFDGFQKSPSGKSPNLLQFTWREADVPKDSPIWGATFYIREGESPESAMATAKAKAAEFGVQNYGGQPVPAAGGQPVGSFVAAGKD